ncbi:hypothetical protein EEJ42_31090 [Streptomyces botrytidirepellens]|uniref:Uncharacterized protein n=1 Tax=Streptomyces botrytidirepellens TaxID=2486417 RepID=A0A3M8VE58_9ACTN|nr:hypothetical protein EEJ42_31090 [Streptomyces botrytidirepellens]
MCVKPDLNTALANLRTNTEAWRASLARHASGERPANGLAWDVAIMESRDEIAARIVDDFDAIDEEMSERRGIDSAAPSAWTIDRLTDDQFDAVKADWPELALFSDDTVRRVANAVGIHMVRAMAREAVRRAPAVLNPGAK